MRTSRQPLRYVLLAAGSLAVVVAALVLGTVADARHVSGLGRVAAIVAGAALGLAIGMIRMAYLAGVRGPALGRQMTAMIQAMDAGQQVYGRFQAALRELVPGLPPPRWKRGRVTITARSVTWVRRITGRALDLTGAQCTGERRLDRGYQDMTLSLPDYYKGENPAVMTLRANGTSMELAAPARLLEILRYSLARTTSGAR